MKKIILLLSAFLLITNLCSARELYCYRGRCIRLDTTNFGGALSPTDTTSQKAFDTIDDLVFVSSEVNNLETIATDIEVNEILTGTASNTGVYKLIPSCSNATTSKLLYNNSTQTWSCGTDQTGGAIEGTAVLSTGEGGGTKYLREDGDGTSSWQTPAGSGDFLADGTVDMTGNFNINTQAIEDANSNELMTFITAASAVNNIQVTNAATGDGVKLTAVGGDTDIDLHLEPKGIGIVRLEEVLPATAGQSLAEMMFDVDSSAQVSTSEFHAILIETTGTPAGEVAAIGTVGKIDPIHQHIATLATPSQTEFAGEKTGGGATWADGIDGSEIFVANSDEIYFGSSAQFDEVEVIMGTGATKNVVPTFWYNTAADTWTQFFPDDGTDGFQQSGDLIWLLSGITGSWTNDGDPGGADTTAGYWIKIIRTRVSDPGSPTPTTVKIGLITTYSWDKTGAIDVLSLEGDTVTEGGNAVPNVTDKLDVFAATTSAELSTVLSDEDGTGDCGANLYCTGGHTHSAYAPLDSPTFTTKMTLDYATASELVSTNASKELVSLAVATYPSLAELAYVKGVSSAIQTQLNAKDAVTTAGDHLTRTANDFDLDAEISTAAPGFFFESSASVEDFANVIMAPSASIITRVDCWTFSATTTLNIDNGGNDVLSSDIVCDVGGQSSCASGCDVNTINTSYDDLTAYTPAAIKVLSSTIGNTTTIYVTRTIND